MVSRKPKLWLTHKKLWEKNMYSVGFIVLHSINAKKKKDKRKKQKIIGTVIMKEIKELSVWDVLDKINPNPNQSNSDYSQPKDELNLSYVGYLFKLVSIPNICQNADTWKLLPPRSLLTIWTIVHSCTQKFQLVTTLGINIMLLRY